MALNLRLHPELDERLRKAAAAKFVSLNTLVVMALDEYTKPWASPAASMPLPVQPLAKPPESSPAASMPSPAPIPAQALTKAQRRELTAQMRSARKK